MIAEPMTLLTDYALAGVAGWAGLRLLRRRESQGSRSAWALAFAALALAAAVGGSYHGFAPLLPAGALFLLWKLTVLAAGLASFGMLAGSALAVAAGGLRRGLLVFAAAKFALYAGWMLTHDDFIYVIADSGVSVLGVAALHAWQAWRNSDRASAWVLGGVAISLLAAAVQASGFALHRHFNHNDLYHLVQIAAVACFYAGASRLHDRVDTKES